MWNAKTACYDPRSEADLLGRGVAAQVGVAGYAAEWVLACRAVSGDAVATGAGEACGHCSRRCEVLKLVAVPWNDQTSRRSRGPCWSLDSPT